MGFALGEHDALAIQDELGFQMRSPAASLSNLDNSGAVATSTGTAKPLAGEPLAPRGHPTYLRGRYDRSTQSPHL